MVVLQLGKKPFLDREAMKRGYHCDPKLRIPFGNYFMIHLLAYEYTLLYERNSDSLCLWFMFGKLYLGIMSLHYRLVKILGFANAYVDENAERSLKVAFLSVWLGGVIEQSVKSKLFGILTVIIYVKSLLTETDIKSSDKG